MKSSDSKQFHPDGGEKLCVPMPSHLQEQALTVFRVNDNDQRVMNAAFLIRKACRKLLGIENDDEVEKVFNQALLSLPKHEVSPEFRWRVHEVSHLRNRVVHKGYHATDKEVEECEKVRREFSEKVATYLGMSAPETQPQRVRLHLARVS